MAPAYTTCLSFVLSYMTSARRPPASGYAVLRDITVHAYVARRRYRPAYSSNGLELPCFQAITKVRYYVAE